MDKKKIYVASSWRCLLQPAIVSMLRNLGHEVYDFKNPTAGNHGFHWSEIGKNWKDWTPTEYKGALENEVAVKGFNSDFDAMKWADVCVLVLPCGRSAHLEAGYFVGAGRPLYIVMLDPSEPELMYKMASGVLVSTDEIFNAFEIKSAPQPRREE